MRRPSNPGDEQSGTPDAKLEAFFARILQRYPRFFLYLGLAIGALILIAAVLVGLSGRSSSAN